MEDDKWFSLVFFLENSPFPDLIEHLEINPKLWYEWCSSEQPENMALPRHMEKNIKGISRLALVKCLRPDRFIEAGQMFIDRTLRYSKKNLNVSSTIINLASTGIVHEPIIIRSHLFLPVENILKKILPICHPVLTADPKALNIFTLGSSRDEYLRFLIQSCSQKGYWLLLKCKSNINKFIACIESEMEVILKHGGNRRFKLWIYDMSGHPVPKKFAQVCQIIFIPPPLLLKESIEHLFELTGENRINCYTNGVMKRHLLCLALTHIALENRQNFSCDVVNVTQKISESQWNEVEALLRDFMLGLYPEGIQLRKVISPFYTSSSTTEEWCNAIYTTVARFLAPDMVLSVSERISALTHYSVPHANDIASHLAQLEFVYKAPASALTNVSQSLYNSQQTIYCKRVEQILSQVLIREKCHKSFTNRLMKLEILKHRLSDFKPKWSLAFLSCFEREKNYIVGLINLLIENVDDYIEIILVKLENSLAKRILESEILCKNCLLKKKLNFITERAKYLLTLNSQDSLTSRLVLGNFKEPLCFWSFLNRKIWFETNSEEVVSVSLTKGTILQDDNSSEGTPEILLHSLFLIGASWDFSLKKMKQEENPSLSTLFVQFNLAVIPLSEAIRKFIDKSDRSKYKSFFISNKSYS